ncbi:MAG: hypothetical protein LC777_22275, partial [Actinobacteria bacterium]|nr:hypothetical protein [Actinomycetota bacterium]
MVGVVRSNDPGERMLADPSSEMALMACGGNVQRLQRTLRGRGNYYRRAHVRRRYHRLDRWVVMRVWNHQHKHWRNAGWRTL